MRFKIDENVHPDVSAWLREKGEDAETVWDEGLAGSADDVIGDAARREQRTLITLDAGFGDIRTYSPSDYFGIIVLRIGTQDRQSQLRALERIYPLMLNESLRRSRSGSSMSIAFARDDRAASGGGPIVRGVGRDPPRGRGV